MEFQNNAALLLAAFLKWSRTRYAVEFKTYPSGRGGRPGEAVSDATLVREACTALGIEYDPDAVETAGTKFTPPETVSLEDYEIARKSLLLTHEKERLAIGENAGLRWAFEIVAERLGGRGGEL